MVKDKLVYQKEKCFNYDSGAYLACPVSVRSLFLQHDTHVFYPTDSKRNIAKLRPHPIRVKFSNQKTQQNQIDYHVSYKRFPNLHFP